MTGRQKRGGWEREEEGGEEKLMRDREMKK